MTTTRIASRCTRATTCIASISFRRASVHAPRWLESSFGTAERRAAARRSPQSLAGLLAAKIAAVDLCSDLLDAPVLTERDFVVTHRATGAPRIAPVRSELRRQLGTLFVSISHSRTTACAVVSATLPPTPTARRRA